MFSWQLKIGVIYYQQAPPILPFCLSLSKDKFSDGSAVATMLSRLKSTHAFKQVLSSGLEWTILTQNLLILPFTMGLVAVTWVLSSWKIERLSQALCFSLFDQLLFQSFLQDFQIKLRDSLYDPFKSLICGISRSSPRHVCSVCLLSTLRICGFFGIKAYWGCLLSLTLRLIGLCGAHRWGDNSNSLAYIV
jgi:hypothetical protein